MSRHPRDVGMCWKLNPMSMFQWCLEVAPGLNLRQNGMAKVRQAE